MVFGHLAEEIILCADELNCLLEIVFKSVWVLGGILLTSIFS